MARFRTRRFQRADEVELNDRYLGIMRGNLPGFSRSLEQMRWFWYQAPGGAIDSWVIETENADGAWKIIGHHGLCPVRFTLGDLDLLCAKTVNTFLLPEFRSKFLYLRFEQQCLQEARSHYDATYTYGPGTARLRKALGYDEADVWLHLEHGSRSLDFVTRMFTRFVKRFPGTPWTQLARAWTSTCALTASKPSFRWIEYTSAEALQSPFFADFWQQARAEAGMSPRRDVADLAWRFWMRPDSSFVTLSHAWQGGGRAYCIVDTSNPFFYSLVDIYVTPARPDLLNAVLDALFAWCAHRGALIVSFNTTSRGQPEDLMEVFLRRMRMHPLRRFRPQWEFPRYLSPRGRAEIGAPLPRWNTSDLLLPL